jgi:hypothetical protein
MNLNQGFTYRYQTENHSSPVLPKTAKIKNDRFSIQNSIFKIGGEGGGGQKPIDVSGLSIGFWLVFNLKFKLWMKNNKRTDFFGLSLDFSSFHLKKSKIEFLKL